MMGSLKEPLRFFKRNFNGEVRGRSFCNTGCAEMLWLMGIYVVLDYPLCLARLKPCDKMESKFISCDIPCPSGRRHIIA